MKKSTIALAVATAMGAGAASAATIDLTLVSVESYSGNSPGDPGVATILSSANWTYDTDTGIASGAGVQTNRTQIGPKLPSRLFDNVYTDTVMGGGGAASASAYECIEGGFGSGVGAHLCGNYSFGANYYDDSTLTYGPGTDSNRTLNDDWSGQGAGPDDFAFGPWQSIAQLDGMDTQSFGGGSLVMTNASGDTGEGFTSGYNYNFSYAAPIPVPAAVWLFGSALGLLGWARKRA